MKAQLTFDLDDIDERTAHLRCIKSEALMSAIHTFHYNTKKRLINLVEEKGLSEYEAVELVFDEFELLMGDHNIIISELIN
jgi:hypothetical protein